MTAPHPRIARSTLINLAGLLIPTLVSLATVPLYLRWIGEVRYGVLLLAFSLLGYFGAFDLGLGRAVAQRIARQENDEERNRTFWTAFLLSAGMGILGGIILFFLGHWLFSDIFQMPIMLHAEAQKAIPWLAAIVPLIALISVLAGTLEARQAFVSLNVSQIIGVIGLQTLPLLSVALGHGSIAALIASALVGRLMGVIVMFWLTARRLPFAGWPALHRAEIGPLLRFGGWVSVSGAVIPLLTIIDRLIIGARLGAAAVTAYTVPFNLSQRLTYLPYALSTTLFPRFSQAQGEDAKGLLRQAVTALSALQTPFIVLAILLIHPFLILWIGATLAAKMAPVAIILLLGIWINGPAYIPYAYMPAQGRPDLMTKFYLVELVPFLLILWVLIAWLGIVGAALAWVIRSSSDAIFCFAATGTAKTYGRAIGLTLIPVIAATFMAFSAQPFTLYLSIGSAILAVSLGTSYYLLPKALRVRMAFWRKPPLSPYFSE
ncbi:teichoic acid transporter [Acidithiobacillus thiooxidans]|jgi:O-antigen/teichoic acid export membrane protein|uniref:Teichoic acid transporter n=2 Tax=Acidithiobacillus thiooxidans TaxID=930 RepID=A0A1C2HVL1_ACITH|nr:flippase [Acidithiobacillus thiooxidans]MBU2841671.1 flippase [Acidithiobacillus thiooxidans]OCX67749.1 teichoic acid transporter [Acidithiobacillus thiooxidans]OCX71098.1 teichoic acid transporter [Acidithiobacillus thiooxidans]OCX75307.1 teichoic acid transporter [Acidithiobacillus thiooxidans]OCX80550.1 teichoic acid transporter [Acidithiobacillus thiooxidans]